MIAPELLEILGCPLDPERPPLRLQGDRLWCDRCGYAFPIVDGVPHLTPESAIPPEAPKEPKA